ncbi:MAG TPA: SCO family protein [Gammaproteobacteria bacterium]|jgi:protein SCO1/2
MKKLFRLILIVYIGLAYAGTGDESLYQLKLHLTDQDGADVGLDVFQGKPMLITMFYGSCPYVCPLTIKALQSTEAALEPHVREQLRVLLVSLDSEHDTPAVLAEVADKQNVDRSRWKLVRADSNDVRKLAAVLGVRYRKLPEGGFNHSTVIALLDANGIRVTDSNRLQTDPALIESIRSLMPTAQ